MALTDKLKAIADAIRSKTGSSDVMTLDEMPEKIAAIESGSSPTMYIEETVVNGHLTAARLVGYDIVRIGFYREETSLVKVELSESVTTIKVSAFNGCSKLADITLPDSITNIEWAAFYNCKALSLKSLPPNLTTLGKEAFKYCKALKISLFPNNLKEIPSEAFEGCTGLDDITLPTNLETVGWRAFADCSNLSGTLAFGYIKTIEAEAFYNASKLSYIHFNPTNELPTIASDAFSGCTNVSFIDVPWDEGEVPGAPWGATNATVNYRYGG